ncbi:putative immunity protein [Mycobacterium sp.]|uniref:putative immunity protein n=1 Tax=Mycobacterium sp. TaxID=1785 RepID=UPI002D825268|nr:hypothetical protein [Mycobacterium sp.]
MADENLIIELSMVELRAITGYAMACAEPALTIFERDCADHPRARAALDEARRYAAGAPGPRRYG